MKTPGTEIKSSAILCNVNKEGIENHLRRLTDILDTAAVSWQVENDGAEILGIKGFERFSLPKTDVVMVLGGDGTMLAASRAVGCKEIPILGINLGRLGFLTELDMDEIEEAVPKIIEGNYTVDSRIMLDVRLPGSPAGKCALNELVIDRGQSPRFVNIEIFVSGQLVAHVAADGLIISTPTGSTAYNMSAGGAIMSPEMPAFQIITLSPYTLSIRPVIISADEEIKISFSCDSQEKPRASLDGQLGLELPNCGDVIIKKADYSAHFIHYHNRSFYSVLHRKLGWALPPGKSLKDAIWNIE